MKGREKMTGGFEQDYTDNGDTWPKVLKYNYEKYGDHHRAMRHKHYGIWRSYTWKEYYLSVKDLALGMLALGFKPEDKLLIIGDNAPEWYYAELAAHSIHGVAVGLYSDSNPAEIRYISENADVRFAIVEDQEQVDKFLQIKDGLPLLEKVIYWNYKGLAHYDDDFLIGYRQVIQLGKGYEEENPGTFERNVEEGKADDVCAIVYTSGTTGDAPKGAVHTFETMRVGSEAFLGVDPWYETDNVVPYLPPAWMTEQWLGIGCHLLSGCILNFAEAPETQQRDSKETDPSIVYYGARLWESQASTVQARILNADAIKRFVFRKLMPVGYKMADSRYERGKAGLGEKMLYSLANVLLLRLLRKSLGLSNARICYSSGSMLSPDAFKFYHALNVPLKNLYVSTEGGPLTVAANHDIRPETAGRPHQEAQIKITHKGEIVYRQEGMFKEYYKDPVKTEEAIKDGWFFSGDGGFVREDGQLVFMDRLEDVVEISNGEKVAPQFIESRLRFSPYVMDAWVVASAEKKYAAAIIIIDYNNVSSWAGQRRVPFNNFMELSQAPEVYELAKTDIERINQDLSPDFRIKKFMNLPKPLSPEDGELTRNRKLKRGFLKERYHDLIDAINQDKPEAPIEDQIGSPDGKRGSKKITIQIRSI